MAEELRLKTNHTPSIFNKDMLLGGMLGLLVPGGLVVGAIAVASGVVIGGLIGKQRQERENREGKKVDPPSIWNKDTLIGGLIGQEMGFYVGAIAAGLIVVNGAAAINAFGGGTELIVQVAKHASGHLFAALGALFASWAGGAALGAYIGGASGERRMAQEYETAKHQQIVHHVSQNVSP